MKTNPIQPLRKTGVLASFKSSLALLVAMCVLALAVSSAKATVLLTEDFNYTAATLLTANGWTAHNAGGTTPQTIVTPSPLITFSGYSGGSGNAVSMGTSGEDDNKTFTATTSGSIYAAFLVYVTASQTTGDYFIHFQTGTSTFAGRVFVKKDPSSTSFAFGLAKQTTTPTYTAGFTYALNTTYLLVVKYTYNLPGTLDDSVSLFINPTPGSSEPTATIASVTDAITDMTTITAIGLRQGSAGNMPTVKVDGIRVATTWAEATAASCTTPTAYTVTGGNGCTATGVTIGLNNSDVGINYQLKLGASSVGSFVAGTGAAISFGSQTTAGTYTVVATNTVGNCTATMTGSSVISTTVSPSVSVVQSPSGSICSSSPVTFTATPINGGASPSFIWRTNGVIAQSGSSPIYSQTGGWVNGDTVDCELTSSDACASPTTASATQITLTVVGSVTPSVTVTANTTFTICAGTTVTFTANPVNGGSTPTYVWRTNSVIAAGSTGSTFISSTLVNGETIDCELSSSDPCASPLTANAPQQTMTVNATVTPSVTIAGNNGTTVCSNSVNIFTATPVNGGTAPLYVWRTNGVIVAGVTGATYTNSSLINGQTIDCQLTASADVCPSPSTANASQLTITLVANVAPSVTVVANTGTNICVGTTVTFTATPVNGGASPTYIWKKNTVVVGTSANTYVDSGLNNLDKIDCTLVPSGDICVLPATTNATQLTMVVRSYEVVVTTVVSENVGSPSGTTVIASYTGWQNNGSLTFTTTSSASSDVRTTAASTGYLGGPTASGSGNVFFGTAGGPDKNLIIAGINTVGLSSLRLQFGLNKVAAGGGSFAVEVSTNGTDWSALTVPQPTSGWTWTTCTGEIPATANLRIRFSKSDATAQYRVDDIRLAVVSTNAVITATGSTTNCVGTAVTLTASAGSAWLWGNGETAQAISVSPTTDTNYSVVITDANGCSSAGSLAMKTNTAPIGVLDTFTRVSGLAYKVKKSDLVANDTDVDPDTLTVTSFDATSTNGATLTSDANYIYVPANTVADAFNYTFSDGCNTGSSTVNLSVTGSTAGQASASVDTSGGNPTVTFYGVIGSSYTIEVSPDATTWSDLINTTAPSSGVIRYTDAAPPTPAAFYRLRYNP